MLLYKNKIDLLPYDLIMIDEASDLSAVMLEIFRLLPANKKALVGEYNQAIFGFSGNINGFDVFEKEGTLLPLTKSFRCNVGIAQYIQSYLRSNINKSSLFVGTNHNSYIINSVGYVSRYNSSLIETMFKLDSMDIPFRTIRNPKAIFKLYSILTDLLEGRLLPKKYNFLLYATQGGEDDYSKLDKLRRKYDGVDKDICYSCDLIMKYKKRDLLDIYNKAIKNYEDTSIDTILCTVFTAKGMTIDEVFVNKDLKITEDSDDEDKRLLYVAYSRAKHILHTDKGELIL